VGGVRACFHLTPHPRVEGFRSPEVFIVESVSLEDRRRAATLVAGSSLGSVSGDKSLGVGICASRGGPDGSWLYRVPTFTTPSGGMKGGCLLA